MSLLAHVLAVGGMPWAKKPAPVEPEPEPSAALPWTIAAVLIFWVLPFVLLKLEAAGALAPKKPPHVKKTYVVTGASAGIGLDLVKALAKRGDKVFALVRSRAASWSGIDAVSEVAGDVTVVTGVDVAKDDVGTVLSSALAGVSVDVLINNVRLDPARADPATDSAETQIIAQRS